MKIINHTSIPTEELKSLVKWVCPTGLRLSEVTKIEFVNGNWFSGLAQKADGRIKVKVPPYQKLKRPDVWGGYGGYLRKAYYSWEELLIGITAHELRHIQQFKNNCRRFRNGWVAEKPESEWSLFKGVKKIRKYNLGTSGKLIEVDASLYEMRKVREYRRSNLSFIKTKQ